MSLFSFKNNCLLNHLYFCVCLYKDTRKRLSMCVLVCLFVRSLVSLFVTDLIQERPGSVWKLQ